MNAHAAGIAALTRNCGCAGARSGEQGFGLFTTPAQIEAKAAELGASFDSFARDVQAFAPPADRAEEWKRWAASWRDFQASWEALRYRIANEFWVRASGGTADLILQFQDRLAQWQREFAAKWHAQPSAPPVEQVEAVRSTPQAKHSRLADIASGVAVGVATALILYGLRKAIA